MTLGLGADAEHFRVLDANSLATWASEFPALAVSQVLGGPGFGAQDFGLWAQSNRHQTYWTPSEARQAELEQLRAVIAAPDRLDIRVRGVSGIGKTRLVLESARGTDWEPLVAYVPDVNDLSPEFLNHVLAPSRAVVLIVDECESRRHEKLAERIPVGSSVRLATIGQDADYALRSPVVSPEPMPEEALSDFLKRNYPSLGNEGRRFVVAHADGNVLWAMVLADRCLGPMAELAAELIRRDDIRQFTTQLIPEGRPFLLSAVLALFERLGWDRDLRHELAVLADFTGATFDEFEALALDLEPKGLLARQGRYRAIVPHPLAVVLATEAWNHYGERLVTELMPRLSSAMAMSLLTRVTHLGTYEPARSALVELISAEGEFASLDAFESNGLASFLTKLAVVMPDEMTRHLSALIEAESIGSLRAQVRSRRDLVWTLEKLVWHSRTFEDAADALLRLALAENETYANNATGLWVSLFAAALPATAALPSQRIDYLRRLLDRDDPQVGQLLVQACASNLHPHESVMVSGENQGGVLVEPRGSVRSESEALEYRRQLIEVLCLIHGSHDDDAARAAADGLISAVHPLIDTPLAGDALARALREFRGDDLARLRKEIEGLRSLFRRHPNSSVERALDDLTRSLPNEEAVDRVRVLAELDPWSFQDEHHEGELETVIAALAQQGNASEILDWLKEREIPSGWHVGHALAKVADTDEVEEALVAAVNVNLAALAGFLTGRIDNGVETAFDDFFSSPRAAQLTPADLMSLATRGPHGDSSKRRVKFLAQELSVRDAAVRLFGWQRDLDGQEVNEIINSWLHRFEDQLDYNAAVDWLSLWFHERPEAPPELQGAVRELVVRRAQFPNLGHEAWDWSRLASVLQTRDPTGIAVVVLDLVSDGFLLHSPSEEAALLSAACDSEPQATWQLIADRLEAGDWRLSMSLRGWITRHVPIAVLRDWVGDDVKRARLLAQVAAAGEEAPTPAAEYLLTEFGLDDEVQSALAGEFISGSWWGEWSSRVKKQIEHLKAWQTTERSEGTRAWARRMTAQLERDLASALEREAEDNR